MLQKEHTQSTSDLTQGNHALMMIGPCWEFRYWKEQGGRRTVEETECCSFCSH